MVFLINHFTDTFPKGESKRPTRMLLATSDCANSKVLLRSIPNLNPILKSKSQPLSHHNMLVQGYLTMAGFMKPQPVLQTLVTITHAYSHQLHSSTVPPTPINKPSSPEPIPPPNPPSPMNVKLLIISSHFFSLPQPGLISLPVQS